MTVRQVGLSRCVRATGHRTQVLRNGHPWPIFSVPRRSFCRVHYRLAADIYRQIWLFVERKTPSEFNDEMAARRLSASVYDHGLRPNTTTYPCLTRPEDSMQMIMAKRTGHVVAAGIYHNRYPITKRIRCGPFHFLRWVMNFSVKLFTKRVA